MQPRTYYVIGKRTVRKDGVAKVTGREVFASDVSLPHMMQAVVVRSPYPHAEILSVDTSEAEKLGAVCLTYEDVPKVVYNERIVSIPEKTYRDRTVLASRVRHVGEAVAAVAAGTLEQALEAAATLKIEFAQLPAVLSVDEAGKTSIYESVLLGDQELPVSGNVACTRTIAVGDVEAGFAGADLVVEGEFETQRVYHAQLETKATVCAPGPDGGITVWTTSQSIHNIRQLLGIIFGLPLSKINVKRVSIGGAFGSSIQMNSITPICAALALKAGRPVKLVNAREEDMYSHVKYPTKMSLKIGAKKDGTLVAGSLRALVDIGAHNTQAYPLLGCMAGWFASLYKFTNLSFEGEAVYTNKVPACAMQGYGNPQVNFAVESLIDTLAGRLGMDPIDLRLKNYVGVGEEFWGQGPTVRSLIKSCGVEEMLVTGAELIGWKRRRPPSEKSGDIVRGIGVARGFHTSGTGGPKPGEVVDFSSATVKVNEDGSVDVITPLMDHGGGTWDALAKIVAETLKVPLELVGLSPSDTMTTGYDVCTHATRGIYCGGRAVEMVALQVRDQVLEFAGRILEEHPHDLVLERHQETGQTRIFPSGLPQRYVTLGQVARTAQYSSWGTMAATGSFRQKNCPPCFVTHFIEVEVNKRTGEIRVTRAVLEGDCGTPINPDLVEGQLVGGLVRGIGFCLYEDTTYDPETGHLTSGGLLTDYKLPTALEMPPLKDVEVRFASTAEPTGPFGAKGIGEAALNSAASAIANAIYNAVGIRFHRLPISPEKVLKAIKENQRDVY